MVSGKIFKKFTRNNVEVLESAMLKKIKIGSKIYILIGLLLSFGAAASLASYIQMSKIGKEIIAIADNDLPLTKSLSNIANTQLEQAILLERTLRANNVATQSNPAALKARVNEYTTKIINEIEAAKTLIKRSQAKAKTEKDKAEFTTLSNSIAKIETAYNTYQQSIEEVMQKINAGDIAGATVLATQTQAQMKQLDQEVSSLSRNIENFTLAATKKAESDEATAILLIVTFSVTSAIFGAVFGAMIARGVSKPVMGISDAMEKISGGDFDAAVPAQDHEDEIGVMAQKLLFFRNQCKDVKRLEEERAEAKLQAEKQRRQTMMELADRFESNVTGIVQNVGAASSQMKTTASGMASAADQTTAQSSTVAAASEQTTTNVQMVATASEELSASIHEIGVQVERSTAVTSRVVTAIDGASQQVESLAGAANTIGQIVALITDIADQTNLLALNATIEAARAGESGKGFAVVASEVKNLASQTAKATEDISKQVGGIQAATENAVKAIYEVKTTVSEVEEISSEIAAAIEEQSAATAEIARNVEEAASGTQDVSSNILGVSQAATLTGNAANDVLAAASNLNEQSHDLHEQVEIFLKEVRCA